MVRDRARLKGMQWSRSSLSVGACRWGGNTLHPRILVWTSQKTGAMFGKGGSPLYTCANIPEDHVCAYIHLAPTLVQNLTFKGPMKNLTSSRLAAPVFKSNSGAEEPLRLLRHVPAPFFCSCPKMELRDAGEEQLLSAPSSPSALWAPCSLTHSPWPHQRVHRVDRGTRSDRWLIVFLN